MTQRANSDTGASYRCIIDWRHTFNPLVKLDIFHFCASALDPVVKVLDQFVNYMVCKLCDSVFCHIGLISQALRRLLNSSLKSMHVE